MLTGDKKSRYRLPARLSGKAEFDRVFRNGKRFKKSFLQIVVCPVTGDREGRIGFVIPEKSVKKSTKRNRVRRLLRETIRHWWGFIREGHDIVFRVFEFPEADHARYVEAEVLQLLIESGSLTGEGQTIAREVLSQLNNKK